MASRFLHWIKQRQLVAYSLLAFGITWLLVSPLVLSAQGLISIQLSPHWHFLGAFGPISAYSLWALGYNYLSFERILARFQQAFGGRLRQFWVGYRVGCSRPGLRHRGRTGMAWFCLTQAAAGPECAFGHLYFMGVVGSLAYSLLLL